MLRRRPWIVFFIALGAAPFGAAIELDHETEGFINRNVTQAVAGEIAAADKAFAEFAAKLEAPGAALAYAERGHRLYLQGADGAASYAVAIKRDPTCHLAEVYSADAEIDAGDYDGALHKLHPATNDAPEGVEWGMYALALQLRGQPGDRARIREALEASRSRTLGQAGYEALRAWVLSLIADKDLVAARYRMNEMAVLDISRSEVPALEEKLQAYEIESQQGGMTRVHELVEEARRLQQDDKYAEALERCAEAAAIRETEEIPNLAAEINYTWGEHLSATGHKAEGAAKFAAALATTTSGGLQRLARGRLASLKSDVIAAFERRNYTATLSLGDILVTSMPHDHELGAMRSISLTELGRYPEAIEAWVDLAAREEAPDREAKVAYDKSGVAAVCAKAYALLMQADKAAPDTHALCARLVALRDRLEQGGLGSASSHFCLGYAFELLERSRDADAEWALARHTAQPDEQAHLEELIRSYVGQREARVSYGSNYAAFLKYGNVVEQLFSEWTSSESPDFSNPLRKKLSPVQQARWDEIIILIGRMHALAKEIKDLTYRARVTKDVLEGTQQTQEDLERGQRALDRNYAYRQSLSEEGSRIQKQVEKKMADFWRQ